MFQGTGKSLAVSLIRLVRIVGGAGPDFVLGGAFLLVWVYPDALGERMVRHFMFLMLIEFLVVHSSALVGSSIVAAENDGMKMVMFGGYLMLYSLFAGGFSLIYGSAWPLLAFLVLFLGKVPLLVQGVGSVEERKALVQRWGMMCILYLLGAGITVVPPIPRLGITPDVVAAQQFNSSGLWVEEPHRVIAFGFFYFTALGLYEIITQLSFRSSARKGGVSVQPKDEG